MTKKISTANLTLQPLGKAYIAYIIMDTCNYFISIYRLPSVSVRMLCLCEAGCCWLSWLHILTSLAAYLLPFHFCHFSNLPLIWHYFSFDIERERAVSSLSALQLLRAEKKTIYFFLARFKGHCEWRTEDAQRQEVLSLTIHSWWRRVKWWSEWRRTS